MKILIIDDGSLFLKELAKKINSGEVEFELSGESSRYVQEIPPYIQRIVPCDEPIKEEKHPDCTGFYTRRSNRR
jgi:hypothetical protein